jgi:hypothetical protein
MLAVTNDQYLFYSVKEQNSRFEVCAASGRIILVCDDESSAVHYASILSEAYTAGYKMGYKDSRKKYDL